MLDFSEKKKVRRTRLFSVRHLHINTARTRTTSQSLDYLRCDQTHFLSHFKPISKMSTDAAPAPKAKKAAKPKAPAAHPTYKVMVSAAIAALKEKKGSSRQGIIKYVAANYKLEGTDSKKVNTHVKAALVRGLKAGIFKNSKGK